jgi:hypothetical protein
VTRARWIAAVTALVALDVWLLLFQWGNVLGNCEAQFLIVTPQVLASHLLHQRAADRRHAELLAAQQPTTPTSPEA